MYRQPQSEQLIMYCSKGKERCRTNHGKMSSERATTTQYLDIHQLVHTPIKDPCKKMVLVKKKEKDKVCMIDSYVYLSYAPQHFTYKIFINNFKIM